MHVVALYNFCDVSGILTTVSSPVLLDSYSFLVVDVVAVLVVLLMGIVVLIDNRFLIVKCNYLCVNYTRAVINSAFL